MKATPANRIISELLASVFAKAERELTKGEKGATIGWLNKYLGGNDNRHMVLKDIFNKASTHDLDDDEWWALWKWIGSYQEEGEWKTRPEFQLECTLVLTHILMKPEHLTTRIDDSEHPLKADVVQFLGGVITNVQDDEGNWADNRGVELPEEAIKKPPTSYRPMDVEF